MTHRYGVVNRSETSDFEVRVDAQRWLELESSGAHATTLSREWFRASKVHGARRWEKAIGLQRK